MRIWDSQREWLSWHMWQNVHVTGLNILGRNSTVHGLHADVLRFCHIIESGGSEKALPRRDTIQASMCTRMKCKQKRVLLYLAVFRHVFKISKSMLLNMHISTIFCSKCDVVMSCHGLYSLRLTQTMHMHLLINGHSSLRGFYSLKIHT